MKVKKKIVKREKQMSWEYVKPAALHKLIDDALKEYVKEEFYDSVIIEVKKYSVMYEECDYAGIFLVYNDYETEEEKLVREERENHYKRLSEKRDKAEFERLSKKFGQNQN